MASSRLSLAPSVLIQASFERTDAGEHSFKVWRFAEDHAFHGSVIDAQLVDHRVMWGQRERTGRRTRKIKVRSIEEHAGMRRRSPRRALCQP